MDTTRFHHCLDQVEVEAGPFRFQGDEVAYSGPEGQTPMACPEAHDRPTLCLAERRMKFARSNQAHARPTLWLADRKWNLPRNEPTYVSGHLLRQANDFGESRRSESVESDKSYQTFDWPLTSMAEVALNAIPAAISANHQHQHFWRSL